MCGIAGIVSLDKSELSLSRLKKMTDVIAHRGPDGEGHWINEDQNTGFGHRRLSVIDLSHAADQPMHYVNRFTIIFNGEIYNYLELKELLIKQGYQFTTASDTEVILALYHKEKENCLQLLDGMFSFVIYDDAEKEIFVARDRFGEKPFFYSYEPGKYFLFGSEMKCLWAAGIKKEVNNRMLFNYLNHNYLRNREDSSETFFSNCINLPHSHYLKLSVRDIRLSVYKYYDINYRNIDYSITAEDAGEKFRELFYTSVSRRLRSDVPVGSSLSGGLDSSLVVCTIDKLKSAKQKQETFSAVFPGFEKDERKYIDYVINKTNVSPHFVTPDNDGLIKELEKLCWHHEEPFGSASVYVQYCVTRLAKQHNVTVLLDGQGADEYLAGYHLYYHQFFNDLRKNHPGLYKTEYDLYTDLHKDNNINTRVKKDLNFFLRSRMPQVISTLKNTAAYVKQKKSPFFSSDFFSEYKTQNFNLNYDFDELNGWLHESMFNISLQNLLQYADRNSMAHSREVRLPFLFHELVEFVFTLPSYYKIHKGWTKWIMRDAFEGILPQQIQWRVDKIGYEPPQKSWMGNKEVKARIMHAKEKLVAKGILNPKTLSKEAQAHGANEKGDKSWEVLMAGMLFSE